MALFSFLLQMKYGLTKFESTYELEKAENDARMLTTDKSPLIFLLFP